MRQLPEKHVLFFASLKVIGIRLRGFSNRLRPSEGKKMPLAFLPADAFLETAVLGVSFFVNFNMAAKKRGCPLDNLLSLLKS